MAKFSRYDDSGDKKVLVKDNVLFGDKEDVKLKHANDKPEPSVGGTIIFKLQRATRARPGYYKHGLVYTSTGEWVHVVHHEDIDGTKLGKLLCSLKGYSDFRKDNVWNRYDWCHYRNWGTVEDSSDESCSDEDFDKSSSSLEERDVDIHFVPVDGEGQFSLSHKCIEADWYYGARLCDPETKLAYAYVFGDCFVNDELCGEPVCEQRKESDFNIDSAQLLMNRG